MDASESPAVAREALGDWLRIEPSGAGAQRAVLEDHFGEVHAADLLGRCALAALATPPRGELTALHVEWLAPAEPKRAVELRVETSPADPSHRTLLVSGATPLCRGSARVEARDGGPAYQDASLPAGLPAPESLPATLEYARREGWPEAYAAGPVEFRRVGPLQPDPARGESTEAVQWLALRAPLPAEPALRQAALVFLAGFYPHWEFERRVGPGFDYPGFALRSASVWLHARASAEGWLLLRARSSSCAGGLALGTRELFARDGTLVASVASEARVART